MGLIVYEAVELAFNKVTEYEQTATAAFLRERGWKMTREGDTVHFEHVGTKDEKGITGRGVKATGEKFEVPWGRCNFGEVAKEAAK